MQRTPEMVSHAKQSITIDVKGNNNKLSNMSMFIYSCTLQFQLKQYTYITSHPNTHFGPPSDNFNDLRLIYFFQALWMLYIGLSFPK